MANLVLHMTNLAAVKAYFKLAEEFKSQTNKIGSAA